jgi:type II secretory pathway pseudopilin PulG
MTALRAARFTHRAMTLVEAVVATALLAVVAAATLPILTGAARAAGALATGEDARTSADDAARVRAAADQVAADPRLLTQVDAVEAGGAMSFDEPAAPVELPSSGELRVPLRDADGRVLEEVSVRFEVLAMTTRDESARVKPVIDPAIDPAVDSAVEAAPAAEIIRWVAFRLGDATAVRRIAIKRGRRRARVRSQDQDHAQAQAHPRAHARRFGPARGLTLVETLLAIAITSMLSVAVFAWSSMAVRVSDGVGARASADAVARAVLRAVEVDLASYDRPLDPQAAVVPAIERVRAAGEGVLVLATRSSAGELRGAVERTYRLEPGARVLASDDVAADGARVRRVLATNVTAWTAAFDRQRGEVTVSIAIANGPEIVGRFACR